MPCGRAAATDVDGRISGATWWQLGIFKLGMLALGVAIGACWPLLFHGFTVVLAAIAIVCLAYIGWLWLRR